MKIQQGGMNGFLSADTTSEIKFLMVTRLQNSFLEQLGRMETTIMLKQEYLFEVILLITF